MGALELVPQHGLRVTPGLVQSAELLSLAGAGLDAWLADQLERHPALELPAPRACARCGGTVWPVGRHACLTGGDRDLAGRAQRGDDGRVADALAAVAAALGERARAVAAYVLADLDGRGRLDRPLADVAAANGCRQELVVSVLSELRDVLGPGVAAPDLRASLLLQLAVRPEAPPLCARLVDTCLDLLARGDLSGAAHRTGASVEQVGAAVLWLRRLDPGGPLGSDDVGTPPTVPDLVVTDGGDRLVVETVGSPCGAVRVAPAYARLAAVDPAVRADVAAAATVLTRLAARDSTLLRVAQAVVDRQTDHVRGTGPHRAVTRAQIAAGLGLHESTVSRAVAGKTAVWPDGRPRPLSALFGPPGRAARDVLLALVAAGPATDSELARELSARGHPTARRTVAKYRAQLGIPAQR